MPAVKDAAATAVTAREVAVAALRIGTGFVFLWAFLDKMFGLGYSTAASKAWIHVGVRIAAVAGVVLVAMMWAAVWPLAQHASDGSLTGSTNPFVDEHAMGALALIVIGVAGAGSRLGLGALWARLPFVQRHHVLL